jgi:thymidine kinase
MIILNNIYIIYMKHNLLNTYGKLELIIGPMFAGKTSELKRRLNLYNEMNLKVAFINSIIDNRAAEEEGFSTHNKTLKKHCQFVYYKTNSLRDIWNQLLDVDVIGIDEGQFFSNLYNDVTELIDKYNKKIIVSGLDADADRQPFGEITRLVIMADSVKKLKPFCKLCRDDNRIVEAVFTLRHTDNRNNDNCNNNIDVGGSDKYFPVCRHCYLEYMK